MGNIIFGSKFKPYTYDQLAAPLVQQTQAQQALATQYGELDAKASVLEGLANSERDKDTYDTYKGYTDSIKEASDNLAMNGLSGASDMQTMQNLRTNYAKTIIPIQQAYTQRQTLATEQRKLAASGNNPWFSKNASDMKISDLVTDPTLGYQTVNGKDVYARTAQMATALSKGARNDPNMQRELHKLTQFNYDVITQSGFDPKAITKALREDPNGDKILSNLLDNAVNSFGIQDWDTDDATKANVLKQAREFAKPALYQAIGIDKHQIITNQEALLNFKASNAAAIAAEKLRLKNLKTRGKMIRYNTGGNGSTYNDPRIGKSTEGVNKVDGSEEILTEGVLDAGTAITNAVNDFMSSGYYKPNEKYKIKGALTANDIIKERTEYLAAKDYKMDIRDYVSGTCGNTHPKFVGYSELDEAIINRHNESKYVLDKAHSYDYLYDDNSGTSLSQRLQFGEQLRTQQAVSNNSRYGISSLKATESVNLSKNFKMQYSNLMSDAEDNQNIGLFDKDNKRLNITGTELLASKSPVTFTMSPTKGVQATIEGHTYSIKGFAGIDKYNKDVATYTKLLSDYSKGSLDKFKGDKNPAVVTLKGGAFEAMKSNTHQYNTKINDAEPVFTKGSDIGVILVKSDSSEDRMKVLVNRKGEVIGASSMFNEAYGEGTMRAQALEDILRQAVGPFANIFGKSQS